MAGAEIGLKPALLIVDVQNDFVEDGALAVEGGNSIVPSVNKLLQFPFSIRLATRDSHPRNHISFASNNTNAKPFETIITIANPENPEEMQQTPVWPDHCVLGTRGHELVEALNKSRLTHIVDKGQDAWCESFSAFGPPFRHPRVAESDLKKILLDAGVTDVIVCGLATDYCVKHTAIDAAKEGFHTIVMEDACKAIDSSPKGLAATMKELSDNAVDIAISNGPFLEMLKRIPLEETVAKKRE